MSPRADKREKVERKLMETRLSTPWGFADQVYPIGERGILKVCTPSHGGMFVPSELLPQMPSALRYSNSYSGRANWFEEDVEWALVVASFPEEFTADYCKAAIETIAMYAERPRGEYFYSANQWLNSPRADILRRHAEPGDRGPAPDSVDYGRA